MEGGGLVQGVTKLITILLTFVTLNKNMPIELTKNRVESSNLGSVWFFKKKEKKIKHSKKSQFSHYFYKKI